MANTNLSPNPGPVAVGQNQGAPVAFGAQQTSSIQQYDSAGNVVQVATTTPNLPFLAEIPVLYANTGHLADFVVPFDCKVVDAAFNVNATAPTNAGDTWKLDTVALDGSTLAAVCPVQTLNALGANGVARCVTLVTATAGLVAGMKLRVTLAQVGNFTGGTAKVWLVPTAL